jgi:hypothetical protein
MSFTATQWCSTRVIGGVGLSTNATSQRAQPNITFDQIKIGFASLLGILFGLTVLFCGVATLFGSVAGVWLGVFGGAVTLASGIVQAHAGFSKIAMATTMASTLMVLLWSVCIGVFLL